MIMTKPSDKRLAQDGYRPLTEGYQPGSQVIQKGYTPSAASNYVQPPPPRGGSGVMKPKPAEAPQAQAPVKP